MLYDYIIIGGGISGLYSAYNIIKNNPSVKLIIFEKNKIVGGRMNIYNFYGTNVNIGAGVGRKNKDYLLINLLDELNIKYTISKNIVYYYKDIDKINFTKIVRLLKNSYDKNIHNTFTFKKFAIEILGKENYNKLVIYLGYSDYENEDAFETLNYYGLDDNIGNNEVLYIKWNELLDSLVNKIGSNNIKTNNTIISINKKDNYYTIKNNKGKNYYSTKLILATTIDTVNKLLPKLTIYNNIKGQTFLRAYGKFNEKSTDIINNIIKGYTVVNGPIKKIIPINKENGIYMIAYTDNKGAKYFENHLKNKEFFCRKLEETLYLPKNTLKLDGLKCFYWNIGTHYYKPLSKKYKNRTEFIEKCQNPDNNLFVVGEMISRNQGWSQGALESVKKLSF
jgi:hypothetical protein